MLLLLMNRSPCFALVSCCINKTVINFTTHGMHHIGQDEIVILLELDDSSLLPKDIFLHLNEIFRDADRGMYETMEFLSKKIYL